MSVSLYFFTVQRKKKNTNPKTSNAGNTNIHLLFVTMYKCCNLLLSSLNKKTAAKNINIRNKRLTAFAIIPLVFMGDKTNKNTSFQHYHNTK